MNKYQRSHKSSLPVHEGPTVFERVTGEQILCLSHTPQSYSQGVRGYIDLFLQTLNCSMDAQTTNGKGMILKYVSSYVSKAKECFHNDAFYCKNISPSTAAIRYAMQLDICEPEMYLLLASKIVSWTNATRKKFFTPDSVDKARENTVLQKYYTRKPELHSLSLLQWLRIVDETTPLASQYPEGRSFLLVSDMYLFQPY